MTAASCTDLTPGRPLVLHHDTVLIMGAAHHALPGADRETWPLARAGEGWSRYGQPPHRRTVLIPDG